MVESTLLDPWINTLRDRGYYFSMPILYVDGNHLFCTGRNIDSLVSEINDEMSKVHYWVKANKLLLNTDNTNFMLFTAKCFSKTMGNILIDGHQISEVEETTFPGVILDDNLKWSAHIKYISSNLLKGLVLWSKPERFLNEIPYFHCTTHWYCFILITVSMFGVKLTIPILITW